MLHDDAVNLAELGEIAVWRASNVEFSDGSTMGKVGVDETGWEQHRHIPVGWYVESAKTLLVLKSGFQTRAEALAWEKTYYSPSGLGWAELKGN